MKYNMKFSYCLRFPISKPSFICQTGKAVRLELLHNSFKIMLLESLPNRFPCRLWRQTLLFLKIVYLTLDGIVSFAKVSPVLIKGFDEKRSFKKIIYLLIKDYFMKVKLDRFYENPIPRLERCVSVLKFFEMAPLVYRLSTALCI